MNEGTVRNEFHLILSPKMATWGAKPRVDGVKIPRVTKNAPDLKSNEVAVKLAIEVPKSLFLKPSLKASIVVPEDRVSQTVITPEITDNIHDVVKQNTGIDLNISILNQTEDQE